MLSWKDGMLNMFFFYIYKYLLIFLSFIEEGGPSKVGLKLQQMEPKMDLSLSNLPNMINVVILNKNIVSDKLMTVTFINQQQFFSQ